MFSPLSRLFFFSFSISSLRFFNISSYFFHILWFLWQLTLLFTMFISPLLLFSVKVTFYFLVRNLKFDYNFFGFPSLSLRLFQLLIDWDDITNNILTQAGESTSIPNCRATLEMSTRGKSDRLWSSNLKTLADGRIRPSSPLRYQM